MGKLEDEITVFGVDVNWSAEEREASLRGDGVSGWIRVGDDQVEVVVELGALAEAAGVRPDALRASIEHTLHSSLGACTA